jgi:Protein of unknown function (DUF2442)
MSAVSPLARLTTVAGLAPIPSTAIPPAPTSDAHCAEGATGREWLQEHHDELVANWDRAQGLHPTKPVAPREMSELIKIDGVQPLEGHWLRLTFSDGAVKDVDIGALLRRGGIFAPIRKRRELFDQERVNPETHTIEWSGEVDLDPEVLYGPFEPASGAKITRRTVREPTITHA